MRVTLFDPSIREDPSIPNYNLGDLVIRDAIRDELDPLLRGADIHQVSTHLSLKTKDVFAANQSQYRLVCGTNLLASRMKKDAPWPLTPMNSRLLKPVILVGVGWWSDQEDPDEFTAKILKRILSRDAMHSVRDQLTADRLQRLGFINVLNTSCPTLWQLDGLKEAALPKPQNKAVLTALSVWRKDPELDKKFIGFLNDHYEEVYIYPQGRKDSAYIKELDVEGTVLEYSYEAFESFFKEHPEAEYLGLRLHAGIRCLQRGMRSLIVEVDNRAREISKDTNLPTVKRDDFEAMENWIANGSDYLIRLDRAAMDQFLNQFPGIAA